MEYVDAVSCDIDWAMVTVRPTTILVFMANPENLGDDDLSPHRTNRTLPYEY